MQLFQNEYQHYKSVLCEDSEFSKVKDFREFNEVREIREVASNAHQSINALNYLLFLFLLYTLNFIPSPLKKIDRDTASMCGISVFL